MTTLDAYIQHQVYVEGYKNGQAEDAETLYEEITAAIVIALTKLQITNIGVLTKAQLNTVLKSVRNTMADAFKRQTEITLADLKRFMNADLDIMGKLTGSKGAAVNVLNRDRLWSQIVNDPIAGEGVEPKDAFVAAEQAGMAAVAALIKRAWADNMDLSALLAELVGTLTLNRRDGLMFKQKRQLATVIETVIQHISSEIAFRFGALTSTHYVWCAILDSRTTEICRSRNGKAYMYGNGPRPPAHWRCRSFTIPATIVNGEDLPTWFTWIKRQPAYMQDDALGPARGKDLRDGRLRAGDLPGFDRARPLTVKDYADKVTKILSEVA